MRRRTFLGCAAAGAAPAERILKSADKRTGRQVWQITSGDSISHSCYFEAQPFTRDDRFLVYSSNRSGAFQLYAVDLGTGETRQITRCSRLSTLSFSMHPNGREVCYLDADSFCKTEVSTGKTAVVVDLASAFPAAVGAKVTGFSAGRCLSSDGKYTAASCPGWMGLANLENGRVEKTIATPQGTGGHMLICPADPYLVTFVRMPDQQNDMKLPMEQRARTMIADLRSGAIRPYLIMPYGWRATHEYWAPDGERFYFHKKKVPGWVPASICSMKRDGSDWQTHFTSDTLMLGHSMISSDGRVIVSDVQKPKDNPLVLVETRTGRHELLCWPDSSVSGGHPKQAHVHPALSHSGKYVAYTSDRTGTPQVYVVPL
jgi:hypothetical protein